MKKLFIIMSLLLLLQVVSLAAQPALQVSSITASSWLITYSPTPYSYQLMKVRVFYNSSEIWNSGNITSNGSLYTSQTSVNSYMAPNRTFFVDYVWSNNSGATWNSGNWYYWVTTLCNAPSLSSPSYGATMASNSASLTWNASTSASYYKVSWGLSSVSMTNSTNTSSTSYTLSNLNWSTNYYWSVSAVNGDNLDSQSNQTRVFVTPAVPAPSAPTIYSPSAITTNSFTANWSAVTNATSYYLDISTNPSFSTFVYQNWSTSGTSYNMTGMGTGQTYYYRVRAYNASGYSGYSGYTSVATLPGTTNLNTPTNSATSVSINPTLTWNCTGSNIVGYYVYLGTNNPPTNILNGVTNATASRAITGLQYSTTYYWRAVAYNSSGSGVTSSTYSFTTQADPIPLALSNCTPATGSTGVSATSAMWLHWYAAAGAVPTGYRVYYGTDNPPTNIINGTVAPYGSFDQYAGTRTYNTTYYWQIVPYNAYGSAPNCPIWTFTTEAAPAPAAPVSLAASTITTSGFTANWSSATNATKYYLDISTASDFTSFISGYDNLDVGDVTTKVIAGLNANTTYYYRVRANNSSGTSGNSATQTTLTIPNAVTLSSPIDSSTDFSINGTMNWNIPTGGAAGYKVYLNMAASPFAAVLDGATTAGTSYTVTNLAYNMPYTWRVVAYNSQSDAISSATWSFTTQQIPHSVYVTSEPAGALISIGSNPSFVTPYTYQMTEGESATYSVSMTDYDWAVDPLYDSNVITNIDGDKHINFIGTYHHVSILDGFEYVGLPGITITGTASTAAALVVTLPGNAVAASLDAATVMVFTGSANSDLSVVVPAGSWYVIAYYNGIWNHGNPYPCNGPGTVVFTDVPFGAKADVPVIISEDNQTLPVELTSFMATALSTNNNIRLQWTTQSETAMSGYYIYRNNTNDLSTAINLNQFLEASNSSSGHTYSYIDNELNGLGTYYYWLQMVDLDGSSEFSGSVSVTLSTTDPGVPAIEDESGLLSIYPNPFNPSTSIAYALKNAASVSIDIFNVRGQKVCHTETYHAQKGHYNYLWDANDLPSGIYYVRMTSGNTVDTKKVMLMK